MKASNQATARNKAYKAVSEFFKWYNSVQVDDGIVCPLENAVAAYNPQLVEHLAEDYNEGMMSEVGYCMALVEEIEKHYEQK